jgi:hypothetical protein
MSFGIGENPGPGLELAQKYGGIKLVMWFQSSRSDKWISNDNIDIKWISIDNIDIKWISNDNIDIKK